MWQFLRVVPPSLAEPRTQPHLPNEVSREPHLRNGHTKRREFPQSDRPRLQFQDPPSRNARPPPSSRDRQGLAWATAHQAEITALNSRALQLFLSRFPPLLERAWKNKTPPALPKQALYLSPTVPPKGIVGGGDRKKNWTQTEGRRKKGRSKQEKQRKERGGRVKGSSWE